MVPIRRPSTGPTQADFATRRLTTVLRLSHSPLTTHPHGPTPLARARLGRPRRRRGARRRQQSARRALLRRRRPPRGDRRRGRLVRGLRRRLPGARRRRRHALADGALLPRLGQRARRAAHRRHRRPEPRLRSQPRPRRLPGRPHRVRRRPARRQPGRCRLRAGLPALPPPRPALALRHRHSLHCHPSSRTSASAPIPGSSHDSVFERALTHVLEMEGGYDEDPYDPGGPTNLGITLAEFVRDKGDRSSPPTTSPP